VKYIHVVYISEIYTNINTCIEQMGIEYDSFIDRIFCIQLPQKLAVFRYARNYLTGGRKYEGPFWPQHFRRHHF